MKELPIYGKKKWESRLIFVSGFTLLEMIIAIIISSIIITLIYGVFLQINITWNKFKYGQDQLTSLYFFKKAFQHDIEKSSYIQTNDGKTFMLISPMDTIRYLININPIRRTGTTSDTFSIKIHIKHINFVRYCEQLGITEEITIDIEKPIPIKNTIFFKHYATSELLKYYQTQ